MKYKMTEELENVSLVEAYIEGIDLYAAGLERNILLKYNLEDRSLERLGWFDGFQFPESFQNAAIYKFENSLFCFSLHSYEVAEYDLQAGIFRYYHPVENECKPFLICTVCRIEDWVWMFRDTFDATITVFSLKTNEFRRYRIDIGSRTENYIRCNFENSVCIGKRIWRCIPGNADFMVLDTEKLEAYTVRTGLQFSLFKVDGEARMLYAISMDGRNLVMFDTSSSKVTIYETGYMGTMEYPFTGAAEIGDRIFLIPYYENEIRCYERKGDKLHCIKHLYFPEEFKKIYDTKQRNLFMKWKKTEGELWLLPFAGNGMLRLDANSLQLTFYPIKIPAADYFLDVVRFCPYLHEGEMEIGEYLKAVGYSRKGNYRIQSNSFGEVGHDVWEAVTTE